MGRWRRRTEERDPHDVGCERIVKDQLAGVLKGAATAGSRQSNTQEQKK